MKKQINRTMAVTASYLFLFLTVWVIPFARANGASILYDQLNNQKLDSTDSNDFWDFPAWSAFAADDFVVPAGRAWTISEVHAQGGYARTGPAENFNVAFYEDNAGLPGPEVYHATGASYVNNGGVFQISLNSPAVLASGTYWVSVQAHLSINDNGDWWWADRTVQSNSPAAWQNPNGGSGLCRTWTVRYTCLNPRHPEAPDQAFRLLGMGTGPFIVTNTADAGAGSLRQALTAASDGDTIRFDPSLNGKTITLTSGELLVNKSVAITGPGSAQLSVNGNAAGRVFHISPSKTVTMSGLSIVNGISQPPNYGGGGIYNDHANLTLNNCTISGNKADRSNGGGIYIDGYGGGATLTISNCTISGNSAWPGGGLYNYLGTVTIANSTLSGNSDNGYNDGGGIDNGGTMTITNSTLSGNSAALGGAIYNHQNGILTITNGTFSGNFSNNASWGNLGGGIYNEGGKLYIGNTIFKAGPTGVNIYNVDQLGSWTSLGYNLSSDDGGGYLTATGDRINTDPKIGPLQNNGGPTFTHLPAPDSPAIDGSDPGLSMDQRGPGFVRVVNGRADIGAVEVQASAAPTPSPSPSITPTPTPTATATAGLTPTASPAATSTTTPAFTPMVTATATATSTATATPLPTATPTPTATTPPPNPSSTPTPSATPIASSHLANISTRMRVESGDNVLIAGFIVQGTDNKRLLIRGIGPSLTAFGVSGSLADPTLHLFSGDTKLGANDNWADNSNAQQIIATGLAPTSNQESALLISLAPGSYTAALRGKDGGSGIGLVELYDLDAEAPAKVANISTRGFVLTGENVMIGGLIVTGNAASPLVLRGIGPSLSGFGVPQVLGDPLLELHDGQGGLIQANNDWRDTQEVALQNSGLAPTNNLESAILVSVAPGNYTAILKGADDGTGNGLLEVYQLSH
jgi:hypothetical protein